MNTVARKEKAAKKGKQPKQKKPSRAERKAAKQEQKKKKSGSLLLSLLTVLLVLVGIAELGLLSFGQAPECLCQLRPERDGDLLYPVQRSGPAGGGRRSGGGPGAGAEHGADPHRQPLRRLSTDGFGGTANIQAALRRTEGRLLLRSKPLSPPWRGRPDA